MADKLWKLSAKVEPSSHKAICLYLYRIHEKHLTLSHHRSSNTSIHQEARVAGECGNFY